MTDNEHRSVTSGLFAREPERSSPDIELLPCPFCGGTVIASGYIRDGRVISCMNCHAATRGFEPDAEGTARKKWNTRASQPATPTGGERAQIYKILTEEVTPAGELSQPVHFNNAIDRILALPARCSAGSDRVLAMLEERISGYNKLLGGKPDWKPSRSHIETARNLMEDALLEIQQLHLALAAPAQGSLDPSVDKVILIARDVVWFDWSSNDTDAVHAIEQLRLALSALPSTQPRTPEFNLGAYIDDNTEDR